MNRYESVTRVLPSDYEPEEATIRECVSDAMKRLAYLVHAHHSGTPSRSNSMDVIVRHCDESGEDDAVWHDTYDGDPAGRCIVTIRFLGWECRYSTHARGIYRPAGGMQIGQPVTFIMENRQAAS